MTALLSAPGKPGTAPKWTSSRKLGVGTAMSADSNVWFSLSHGIINEVYYPRIDIANIRDLQFVVTDGKDFFSEEKRDTTHTHVHLQDGVPAFHLTNTCLEGRYKIEKRVISDPRRNVLLQEITFTPLIGSLSDYRLYALLAPHVNNSGNGNNGWTSEYKGIPILYAERNGITLACASTSPFVNMSCGYVGTSDAWLDLHENKKLTKYYSQAINGNIALAGEIDLQSCNGKFILALGFGGNPEEAGLQTRASMIRDFDWIIDVYTKGWIDVQNQFMDLQSVDQEGGSLFRISTAVLKTHEGKHFSGSVIASLSIPWGASKGDTDIGGYHLIWPRDQVQTAQAFMASGCKESAREALLFLMGTQEEDGHWAQCMWGDGHPYWRGLQMDECSLPLLLADHLQRENFLVGFDPWPMVSKAASFIIQNGPVTQEDRWEENGGYTPFTLATQIAALLAAADFFDLNDKQSEANYLRETADWWHECLDEWIYVKDPHTSISRKIGVDGYYVRIRPAGLFGLPTADERIVIKNKPEGENTACYKDIVSVDALALVRYGLRHPDDPRIRNTVKVIDALLKTTTARGDVWHRYNMDGYGEHEDGSPYDGTGIGRAWPLFNGERGHYELARGNRNEALKQLRTMAKLASEGGLLPEQIWDSEDIPEKSLFNGHAAGSARPLVWAHAEYLTLLRSLHDGKIFNMPPQTFQRYQEDQIRSKFAIWRFNHRCTDILSSKVLRIQSGKPAVLHWSLDGWKTSRDVELKANELGIYYADIPQIGIKPGAKLAFTFYWPEAQKWEGSNFEVNVIKG